MTRAFKEILNLHFINSFNYNILSIPLFILLIIINIFLIIDLFNNSKKTHTFINKVISFPITILFLLIISEVANILRGI